MRRLYLFIAILISFHCRVFSQSGDSEFFSVLSGLPHSNVRSIFIDPNGFLWIGTSDGISRYDGYSFQNYTSNSNELGLPSSDFIFDIDRTSSNNIVFLTRKGFEFFNPSSENFYFHIDTNLGTYISQMAYNAVDKRTYFTNGKIIGSFNNNTQSSEINLIAQSQLNAPISIECIDSFMWFYYGRTLVKYNVSESVGKKLSELNKFNSVHPIQKVIQYNSEVIAVLSFPEIVLLNVKTLDVIASIDISNLPEEIDNKSELDLHFLNHEEMILNNHVFVYKINIINSSSKLIYKSIFNEEYINTLLIDNSLVVWLGTTRGLRKIIPQTQPISFQYFKDSQKHEGKYELFKTVSDKYVFITKKSLLIEVKQHLKPDKIDIEEVRYLRKINSKSNEYFLASNNQLFYRKNDVQKIFIHDQLANRRINYVHFSQHDSLLVLATTKGIVLGKYESSNPPKIRIDKIIADSTSFSKLSCRKEKIFAFDRKSILEIDAYSDSIHTYTLPTTSASINDILCDTNGNLWLATDNGLYYKRHAQTSINREYLYLKNLQIFSLIEDKTFNIWMATSKGVLCKYSNGKKTVWYNSSDGISNTAFNDGAAVLLENNEILFGTSEGLLSILPDEMNTNTNRSQIQFVKSILFGHRYNSVKNLENYDTLKLKPAVNNTEILFSTLDFYAPQYNTYEYSLSNRNKPGEWNYLEHQNSVIISNLPAGIYQLRIKGRNNHGILSSNEAFIYIEVQAPLWKSKFALLIYISVLFLIIYVIVYARTRQLRKSNKEFKEKERIARKIHLQKEELTLKNKSITDSINYAHRIQMAMMPSLKTFRNFFPESFILYIPKDIVSGDFYWVNEADNKIYFSAVDCTGHGVPGAFMSIIGFELFRRIIEGEKIRKPSDILDQLSVDLQTLFRDDNEAPLHDGMDLAFCSIDKKFQKLEFAGAFNPLYLIRNNSITEFKGNRFSVGWNGEEGEIKRFENHTIDLRPGDVIYIFTDGYADQFGGPEGKKYKYRRFRHLLLALHQLSLDRQEEFLRKSIMEWKGENDQVDDILVIGIRIPSI